LAGYIPEHIIAQVQSATDIVGVISQYVPNLRKVGRNLVAPCPFHKEKDPSFSVSPEKQIFYCFGCKEGGTVFRFLMLQERMEFPEAVRYLADLNGIQIPDESGVDPRKRAAQKSEREALLSTLSKAASFYASQLKSNTGAAAREYLKGRKISQSTIDLWQLGFAPDSWDTLTRALEQQGVSQALMEKAGLLSRSADGSRSYDRFRGRVMFPILDARDRIIGFGARMMGDGDGPKYLNSPETDAFNKSNCLYGLNRAKGALADKGAAAVVEGYTDVLMAHQLGVPHVVATLGTALTREHIQLLRRYARRVVLVYDSDAAGEKASDRGVELFLEEDIDVSIAALPSGLDPCDFLLEHGPRAFEERIETAQEILEFKLQLARSRYDFNRMDEKARATDEILALVPKIANEIKRDLFLNAAAAQLRLPEATLRARAAALLRKGRRPADRHAGPAPHAPASAGEIAQRDIVTFLLRFPEKGESLFHEVSPAELTLPTYKTIYQVVCDVYEAEGRIDAGIVLSVLETRWPGQEASRIAARILAEDVEEDFEDRVRGSLEWLTTQRERKEVSDLKEKLREAESHGDSDLEVELLKQAKAKFAAVPGA